MKSYQIAEEQGLDRVEASIEQYRVLPDAYFEDPDRARSALVRAALAADA
jgi:hypothetical protein